MECGRFLYAGPSDRNGVALGEAAVAEAAPGVGGQLVEVLQGEVAQAVRPGELPDLLHRVAACNEPVLVGDVGAEVAGGDEGGRGDAHMDLFGPRLPQQGDDLAAG